MAAYPLHMNTGGLLGTGGGPDMGGTIPAHASTSTLTSAPASSLSMGNNSMSAMNGGKREERLTQWSFQETKDFIAIRSDLEKDFTHAKRNKTLWEAIASKMKERGYHRSGEQCKLKWKNLYNRYKVGTCMF